MTSLGTSSTDTNSTASGGCLCGAVRYRLTTKPRSYSLCHCETCRRAAGAPSVAWVVVDAGAFSFVQGTPTVYRSSPNVERTFCNCCGTPLSYQCTTERETIDITTVSLDMPNDFAPTREIWLSE